MGITRKSQLQKKGVLWRKNWIYKIIKTNIFSKNSKKIEKSRKNNENSGKNYKNLGKNYKNLGKTYKNNENPGALKGGDRPKLHRTAEV